MERARHPGRAPAGRCRVAREAVAGHRRQDEVEGVLGAPTVRRRVCERLDDLQQLDDRARPAVRHEQRQGVVVRRADVRELDVQPVDLGDELRQRVERRLDLAPVVAGAPVLDERAQLRQLDALRPVADGLLVGPARRVHPPAKLVDLLLGDVDVEGADRCGARRLGRNRHVAHPARSVCASRPWDPGRHPGVLTIPTDQGGGARGSQIRPAPARSRATRWTTHGGTGSRAS